MLGLRLPRWLRQRPGFTADARGVLGSASVAVMVGGDPPGRRSAPGEQFLKTVRLTLGAFLAGSRRDGGLVLTAAAGISVAGFGLLHNLRLRRSQAGLSDGVNLATRFEDLAGALEFYDRWLPNTMRRIAGMTRACMTQCVMLRRPGDAAYVQRR